MTDPTADETAEQLYDVYATEEGDWFSVPAGDIGVYIIPRVTQAVIDALDAGASPEDLLPDDEEDLPGLDSYAVSVDEEDVAELDGPFPQVLPDRLRT